MDLEKRHDKGMHDQLAQLAEQMLELQSQLIASKVPQEQNVLRNRIMMVDQEIDRIVYELYQLNTEEIAVINSVTKQ